MASTTQCIASLARLSITSASRPAATSLPRFLAPAVSQVRFAANRPKSNKKEVKKRKTHKGFKVHKKNDLVTFSLCDAIRYCRAFEVGQPATSVKYSLAIKLKTSKNGPVIRNNIRLPHIVKTDVRFGVICKENSRTAQEALAAGAIAVGEASMFAAIREGKMPYNRLICETSSMSALQQANLGRILGPKSLMPSPKTKTVTSNPVALMKEMMGADVYREREGVVRMAIGQLGFTPDMLADNVKAFMSHLKNDLVLMEDAWSKEVDEVVLNTSHSPGFSLNGGFNPTDDKITPAHLATAV